MNTFKRLVENIIATVVGGLFVLCIERNLPPMAPEPQLPAPIFVRSA